MKRSYNRKIASPHSVVKVDFCADRYFLIVVVDCCRVKLNHQIKVFGIFTDYSDIVRFNGYQIRQITLIFQPEMFHYGITQVHQSSYPLRSIKELLRQFFCAYRLCHSDCCAKPVRIIIFSIFSHSKSKISYRSASLLSSFPP